MRATDSFVDRSVERKDADEALRLALAATWYWFLRGRLREARRSLADVLRLGAGGRDGLRSRAVIWHAGFARLTGEGSGDPSDDARTGHVRTGHARAEWFLGHALLKAGEDLARSEILVDRALADARAAGGRADEGHALFVELGDRWGQLQTTYPLAALATIAGDHARAAQLHQDGLRLAEELGFWADAADRITGLGRVALLTGDFARATGLHQRARELAAEHGYAAGEIHAEIGLALGARREGRFDLAGRLLDKTLAWHREVEFGPGSALLLAELGFLAEQRGNASEALSLHRQGLAMEGLAGAHALAGRPARAARLLGAATRVRESAGAPLPAAERCDVDRIAAGVRAVLGAESFTAEFSSGAEGTEEPLAGV